jgi:hypothetical protein
VGRPRGQPRTRGPEGDRLVGVRQPRGRFGSRQQPRGHRLQRRRRRRNLPHDPTAGRRTSSRPRANRTVRLACRRAGHRRGGDPRPPAGRHVASCGQGRPRDRTRRGRGTRRLGRGEVRTVPVRTAGR